MWSGNGPTGEKRIKNIHAKTLSFASRKGSWRLCIFALRLCVKITFNETRYSHTHHAR